MREAFRLTAPSLVTGVHIVLIARSGIKDKKCAEVMKDFERIAKRAKLWGPTVR
jgi:RNase P protein component